MDGSAKTLLLFSIEFGFLLTFVGGTESIDEDMLSESKTKTGWIDPGDMIGYDFDQEKARIISSCEQSNPSTQEAFRKLQDEVENYKKQLAALTNAHNKCILDLDSVNSESGQSCDMPYFKRYLRNVLEKIESLGASMQLTFTEHQIQSLKDYLLHDKGNVHDVNTMLGEVTDEAQQPEDKGKYSVIESVSLFFSHEFVFVALITVVSVTAFILIELYITISWRRQILCIVILGFFMSIPWEWIRLYRREFALKQSQVIAQAPQHCITGNMTAYESFQIWIKHTFTFSDDPCSKYQEALLVDPLWEVTPAEAVSVTLTKFCVAPLEHICHAAGKGFRALFKEIPVQWQPVVFIATVIFVLALVILLSGAQIWTPLLRISFDRGNQNTQQVKQLENKVDKLLELVNKQAKENQQLLVAVTQNAFPQIEQADEKEAGKPVQDEDKEESSNFVETVGSNK